MINHYSLLKISPDADQATVETAFFKFKEDVETYGPGMHLNDDEIKKQFPEICAAYEVLLNPAARKEYDAALIKPVKMQEQLTEAAENTSVSKLTISGMLSYIGFAILFVLALYAMSFFFAL
jgi:DnaJ-class molecular chaperone